jgi:hypothetical protein
MANKRECNQPFFYHWQRMRLYLHRFLGMKLGLVNNGVCEESAVPTDSTHTCIRDTTEIERGSKGLCPTDHKQETKMA